MSINKEKGKRVRGIIRLWVISERKFKLGEFMDISYWVAWLPTSLAPGKQYKRTNEIGQGRIFVWLEIVPGRARNSTQTSVNPRVTKAVRANA
jgi:hypothetical protein